MKKVGIILVLAVALLTLYTIALAEYATINGNTLPTADAYEGGL